MYLTSSGSVHRVPLCKLAGSGAKSLDAPSPLPERLLVLSHPLSRGARWRTRACGVRDAVVFEQSGKRLLKNRDPGFRVADVVERTVGTRVEVRIKESDHGRQQGEPGSSR